LNTFKNVVVVVQARSNSTRLKNKVFLSLCGKELLLRMIERIEGSCFNPEIVVATTCNKEDDRIVDLCEREGKKYFRGSENDLLDRHLQTGIIYGADVVVKIPSDCPLIDPEIIDKVLSYYISNSEKFDYVSNLHPATYPDGNDVEVMSIDALEKAWREAEEPYEREHTTPFIWDNPEMFSIGNVEWEHCRDYSMSHRFTIDYKEDYDFIKRVYKELYPVKPRFTLNDILSLLRRNPEIMEINRIYAGVNWYRNIIGKLKTISEKQTRNI